MECDTCGSDIDVRPVNVTGNSDGDTLCYDCLAYTRNETRGMSEFVLYLAPERWAEQMWPRRIGEW